MNHSVTTHNFYDMQAELFCNDQEKTAPVLCFVSLSGFFYLFNFSSWVLSKPQSLLLAPYRIHMMKCSMVIISADWQSSASPHRVADASEVLEQSLEAQEPTSPGRPSAVVADAKPSHFKTNHAVRLQPPLHLPAWLCRLIWWPLPVIVFRNYFYNKAKRLN